MLAANLYHCSAGKDRMGVVRMLALSLVGAELKDIMTNYEVSYTNISNDLKNANIDRFPMNFVNSNPETIKNSYQYIMDNYESIRNYFSSLGYKKSELITLIQRIAE